MCRFLMVKSKQATRPQGLLRDFALMCQESRTLDGDRQKDGWGIAWLDSQDKWQSRKSLLPIWNDQSSFGKIPTTTMFVAHARSASFPNQRGVVEYNQPYFNGEFCFVFNGILKKVRTRQQIKGEIGAQKIWNLLQYQLKSFAPSLALEKTSQFLKSNTQEIYGLNIGLASKGKFFALCGQNNDQNYFALRVARRKDQDIICSEQIGKYKARQMEVGEIISL